MQRFLGYILIITAAALWALIGPVARLSLEAGMSPLEIAFWRALFGGVLFCLHAFCSGGLRIASPRDGLAFLAFGAISIGGFFVAYQASVRHGGAALASVLLYTAPAWVAVFARIVFHEGLTSTKYSAIILCLAGVAGISLSGGDAAINAQGIAFGLLAGLLYATHYIFTKRYLVRYTSVALYAWCLLFGAAVLLPFVTFMPKSPTDWLPPLILGLVSTYAAYWAYCEGLRRLSPVRAAVLATFEPVFATLIAWWWWGEVFAPLGIIGAVSILAAVLLMVREER